MSLAAFLLLCASPLDPLQTNVGQVALGSMSPEQVANLEAYWGVDQPPAQRYLGWLSNVLHGDFGTSLLYRQPVLSVIGQRLGSSLWLLLTAWVLSGVLGLALGLVAGAFRGRWPDKLIRGYCLVIFQHPGLLAGAFAAFGFLRVAGLAAHRAFRAHRRGGERRHVAG